MRSLFICIVLLCATSIADAQISLARYFDENSLPLLDLSDHLSVNFKWDQKGPVQVALNEGLNFLDENELELTIANLSEAIQLDANLWVAYYYRGVAHKKKNEMKEAEIDLLHAKKMKTDQSEICFELGELYHQQGKYDKAKLLYEEAIQLNPNLVDIYFNLGSLQLMQGDANEALKFYNKCNEVNPRFAKAYVMQGLLKFRETKKNAESIGFFTKAIQADSSYSLPYFWRGMMYVYANRNEKCLEDWTHFITFNPGNIFILSMRGYLYIELNRFDEAFVDLRKALLAQDINEEAFRGSETLLDKQIDIQAVARYIMRNGYGLKDETFTHLKKSFCLLISGRKKDALESLKRAEALEQAATIYYLGAIVYEHLDNHPQALQYYNRALEYDNDIFDAHKKRSIYRTEIKDWKGAFADFNDMLRLQPNTMMTYRLRAFTKLNRKDYTGALIDFSQYLKSDSTNTEAIASRAFCRYQIGDVKGGIEDYRKAIALKPVNADIHIKIIEGYFALTDTTEAIRAIDNFKSIMPGQPYQSLKMAEIHIARHQWKNAHENIDRTITELNSFNFNKTLFVWAYLLRSIVSINERRYEDAIYHLEKALEVSPNDREAIYYLAIAFKNKGDRRKAMNTLQKLGNTPFKDSDTILLSLKQSE